MKTTKPTISKAELREKIAEASIVKHKEFKQFLIPNFFMDNLLELIADQQRQLLDRVLDKQESYEKWVGTSQITGRAVSVKAVPVQVIKDIREGLSSE